VICTIDMRKPTGFRSKKDRLTGKRKAYPIFGRSSNTNWFIEPRKPTSEREEGLMETFRSMNPVQVNEAGGLRVGDHVVYKKSERIVDRAWGKYAGEIIEIRKGPSGPTIISSRGVGKDPAMSRIGPTTSVAMIRSPDGKIHFSEVRDLKKLDARA